MENIQGVHLYHIYPSTIFHSSLLQQHLILHLSVWFRITKILRCLKNVNRHLEDFSNPPSLTELQIILFNENCRHLKINAKCLPIFYNLRLFLSAQLPAHLAETSILEQDHSLPSASACFSASVSQLASKLNNLRRVSQKGWDECTLHKRELTQGPSQ